LARFLFVSDGINPEMFGITQVFRSRRVVRR
jgi:hypothetical protein